MSIGKYSPTVVAFYHTDQDWWNKHCENKGDLYDRDGYDEYGYNADDVDRAGKHEDDYLSDANGDHIMYEIVYAQWCGKIII